MKPVPRTRSGEGTKEDDIAGVSNKTLKMRRYRKNISNDPDRLAKMRAKYRERKRKEREEQRNKISNGDWKLEKELKERHRINVANYRAKNKKRKKPANENDLVLSLPRKKCVACLLFGSAAKKKRRYWKYEE